MGSDKVRYQEIFTLNKPCIAMKQGVHSPLYRGTCRLTSGHVRFWCNIDYVFHTEAGQCMAITCIVLLIILYAVVTYASRIPDCMNRSV